MLKMETGRRGCDVAASSLQGRTSNPCFWRDATYKALIIPGQGNTRRGRDFGIYFV